MGLNSSDYGGIESSERIAGVKQTHASSLAGVNRQVVYEYHTYYRRTETLGGRLARSRRGAFYEYS